MASFVFLFESILRLKSQIEESVKNDLGKANLLLEKEKERLVQFEGNRNYTIEEMNQVAIKTSIKVLKDYSNYLDAINAKIEQQKKLVNDAKKNVDIIKRKLMEAAKERKIFEKLKEKKYKEYLTQEKKEQQKLTDETINFKQSKRNE